MKNYQVNIYCKDKCSLYGGLERVYVTSIFFEKVTYTINKADEERPFEVVKFYKNGKMISQFFPTDEMGYEIKEEKEDE